MTKIWSATERKFFPRVGYSEVSRTSVGANTFAIADFLFSYLAASRTVVMAIDYKINDNSPTRQQNVDSRSSHDKVTRMVWPSQATASYGNNASVHHMYE